MALDEPQMIRARNIMPPVRVAANLPYNVATALLVKWLTAPRWPPFWESLTLMFQREVARRITSAPGTADYGRLAVLAHWRARPRILFDVDRRAFTPAPAVTSSLVRIEPLSAPESPARLGDLERVTAAAFGQRRKMLRQSLKQLSPGAETIIRAAGIDPQSRPQDLGVTEFAALARAFGALEGHQTPCNSRANSGD
jgi:16S rRNA (adenine1518-N6/adenine1519-N6)-dimethyltransferase